MHLKPIVNFTISKIFYSGMKNFLGLVGTLENNILLEDGTRYKDCLHSFIDLDIIRRKIRSSLQTPQDCMPLTLFKIMAISHIGENPHTHAALQILKALNLSIHTPHPYSPYIYSGHYHCSRAFLMEAESVTIRKSRTQQWHNQLNSGKIYRRQREIRLMKFRKKKCYYEFLPWPEDYYRWNWPLISTLLIPLLDLCPYSNEVSELLRCCMKQLSLEYSLHRRLRNAVHRYMHCRPDVACRK